MTADLPAATAFLNANARLLERRRFAHLFEQDGAGPVVHVLRGYRNADGGFGHGIEPDMRAPESQPVGVQTAMEILHEAGIDDDPMIGPAADWLLSVTRDDGGIPFMLATDAPHAPWWRHSDASSHTQTAANAAALHNLGVTHPWLDGADEFLFARIAGLDAARAAEDVGLGYDLLFSVHFLDAHPDAARATAALEALGPIPAAEPGSELPSALDLSPLPGSRSRRLFDVERDLDALEAAQEDDGGWRVSWPDWNPAAAIEWRGVATLNALRVLRANERI